MLSQSKKKSGTTLIEIAVAVLIITLLAVAAISALRYPRYRALTDAHKQVSVLAANAELEMAVAMGFNHPSNAANTYAIANITSDNTVQGRGLTTGERTVVDLNESGIDYKRITVTVDYPGSENPVVLETLLYPGN